MSGLDYFMVGVRIQENNTWMILKKFYYQKKEYLLFLSKIFKDAKQHIRKRFRKKTGDSISLGRLWNS